MYTHTAVLLDEVIQFLEPMPGGRFIDATLGAAGHARAILERTAPDGKVLAIDQDESALSSAKATLESFGSRVVLVHSNFRDVAKVAAEQGFLDCDGVLADIGISSMMVDDPSRGFSFMREGPLDMRMDRTQTLTAAGRSGGRVVVIAFHSLEDRIVKNKFRAPAVPGRVLTKKVVRATDEEVRRNPRARSGKLRAWERS